MNGPHWISVRDIADLACLCLKSRMISVRCVRS